MYYTKCCISGNKSYDMKQIIPLCDHKLNFIPINSNILLLLTNKEIYIYPIPDVICFSDKYNIYVGKFHIINISTKYISQYKKNINLPLNTRFFLLYYYIHNISICPISINIINDIFDEISYMDPHDCLDYDGDVIMFPSYLIKN